MIDLPLPPAADRARQLAPLDVLAAIPEEEVWLASQKSARTRRAYRLDVAHFMRGLGRTSCSTRRCSTPWPRRVC